jgi:hypothetical protein
VGGGRGCFSEGAARYVSVRMVVDLGSVSTTVFGMVCGRVIGFAVGFGKDIWMARETGKRAERVEVTQKGRETVEVTREKKEL